MATKYVDNFPEMKASLQRAFENQRKEDEALEAESLRRKQKRADMGKNYKENMEAGRFDEMGNAYKKGGKVSASKRADGIAQRGKTKGRMC
jgi:hypothetical protein